MQARLLLSNLKYMKNPLTLKSSRATLRHNSVEGQKVLNQSTLSVYHQEETMRLGKRERILKRLQFARIAKGPLHANRRYLPISSMKRIIERRFVGKPVKRWEYIGTTAARIHRAR